MELKRGRSICNQGEVFGTRKGDSLFDRKFRAVSGVAERARSLWVEEGVSDGIWDRGGSIWDLEWSVLDRGDSVGDRGGTVFGIDLKMECL